MARKTKTASPKSQTTPTTTSTPSIESAAPAGNGHGNGHANGITEDQRRHMIAEAAYYKAERCGFCTDAIDQNWLEAEAEINAKLSSRH